MDRTMMTPKARPAARPRLSAGACPPGIVDAGIGSLFEMYGSLVRSAADYYSALLARAATPLDVAADLLEWTAAVAGRKPPSWTTPHEIVAEWPVARLRDFSAPAAPAAPAGPAGADPLLLLPPQAGHNSCIVDYAPGQSQVQTALDAGLARVFSLDWRGATAATKDAGVDAYLDVVAESVEHAGGRVNLVGDCQGGWLAVIYAALYPDTVATLTIAGAPVDFHAGEPLIHDWIRLLSPAGQLDFYRALVAANGGILPGDALLAGYKLMQPEAETDRQLQLLAHIGEAGHSERYRAFEDWFQHTQAIPGTFYLWIVERLFMRNELVLGDLEAHGRRVDLAGIRCPLYLLAGAKDHITPPPQVFALADFASTPANEITRATAAGGHLGLFMGHESLHGHWAAIFAGIARRSAAVLSPDASPGSGAGGGRVITGYVARLRIGRPSGSAGRRWHRRTRGRSPRGLAAARSSVPRPPRSRRAPLRRGNRRRPAARIPPRRRASLPSS
jgi:poly(3-hydroxybutyrate) depolymerase